MLKTLFLIFLSYIGYCCFIFLIQQQLMFPCYMIESPPEIRNIPGLEKIWLNTDDGKFETWFFPPITEGVKAPAVIFAHGNGELIDFWHEDLRRFTELGIGLMLVEYPGYGRSTGKSFSGEHNKSICYSLRLSCFPERC